MLPVLLFVALAASQTLDSVPAIQTRVDRLVARERFADAARIARESVRAFPLSAELHAVAGDAVGALAGRSGVIAMIRLARECRRLYERAVALDSTNLRAQEGLAGYLAQAPGVVGGSRDSALRVVARIERLRRSRGKVARALIVARGAPSPLTDSLVAEALSLDRDSTTVLRAVGYYVATGQHRRALDLELDLLAADSGSAARWLATSRRRLALGDTVAAEESLRAAWTHARRQADEAWIATWRPAWRLAQVAARQARGSDARVWADSVLAVDPSHRDASRMRDSLDGRRR